MADEHERRRIINVVGPAGLHHSRNINHLGRTETLGNSDVSPCLSQLNVSAYPPDIPKTRRYTTADIQQRDDGLWSIGFGDDAAGPFESREFAMSVAGYAPPAPAIPFRKIKMKEALRRASST